jgi:hypothetical protein
LGITIVNALVSWPGLFVLVAIGMSVFYGLRACEIFSVSTTDRKWSWRFHQFWLNFLGSGVGWVAAWAVLRASVECASADCALSVSPSAVSLFFLAFLGVTGYLPATIVGAVGGINELISKLLSLIGGKP